MNIKATNYELLPALREKILEKIGGLDKYFDNIQQVEVEVGLTTNGQQKGKIYFCEVNINVPKKLLRCRKEYEDLNKAINEVKKVLQNELKQYKETVAG